jgi:glycosyltransferase involved in cell wall biosynthesis
MLSISAILSMPAALNILFVNSSRMWGGNEKWTLRAAETLLARGHRVLMAVRDRDIWRGHAHAAVPQVVLPFLNDADVRTIFALRRLIRSHRADIFLPTRSRDYWLGGFANLGLPARYVMRMGITRDLRNTIKERLRYGAFPDGIVVNAEAVRQSLIRYPWVKADRVRVIYNGVDATTTNSEMPPLKQPGEFLIVAAGRVESDKGFDMLIEALALAVPRAPELRCVIFGRGDMEKPLLHRISELGLEKHVRLGGFTTALGSALAQADLAVSSSYREGVSNFILESWSAGVPIIATAIPGSAEIVTDGVRGRLVPPGEPAAMAGAIVEAVEHPEKRAAWAAAGREAIATTFNWTTMAENLEAFFAELLKER